MGEGADRQHCSMDKQTVVRSISRHKCQAAMPGAMSNTLLRLTETHTHTLSLSLYMSSLAYATQLLQNDRSAQ